MSFEWPRAPTGGDRTAVTTLLLPTGVGRPAIAHVSCVALPPSCPSALLADLCEQTPPFLVGLWLHAFFAATPLTSQLGWTWLLLRATYPFVFMRWTGMVMLVTLPSYVIVLSLYFGAWCGHA